VRAIFRSRCAHDGKTTFRRYKAAAGSLARTGAGEGHVYWCPYAGGYHISRSTVAEYDQRRAGAA
jgi:hypothetical protein